MNTRDTRLLDGADLDRLLHAAAERLDDATAHIPIPSVPKAALPMVRIVAAAAAVAVVGTGVAAVATRTGQRPASVAYPPSLLDGTHGSQITLTEQPDGDNDPDTWIVVASPAGGTVRRVKSASGGVATTVAVTGSIPFASSGLDAGVTVPAPLASAVGSTATESVPSGAEFPAGATVPGLSSSYDTCITSLTAGAVCGVRLSQPYTLLSKRQEDGQAMIVGVPGTAFAVTFRSGDVRYWERPLHGIAVFPYQADSAPTAEFEVLAEDGGVLAKDTSNNEGMTDAEVAAAVTTKVTGDTLADGWFVDPPSGAAPFPTVVRLSGRTSPLGFGGPFTVQTYIPGGGAPHFLDVVTVRTVDVSEVSNRLARQTNGSIRYSKEVSPGVSTIVWADSTIDQSNVDRAVATLHEGNLPQAPASLDIPFAFNSTNSPALTGLSPSLESLVSDVVATVDGQPLLATSDDVGDVEFRLGNAGVRVGPNVADNTRVPVVNDWMFSGAWPVPADVTSVRITLDDGTVVTPQVVDVTAIANIRLLVVTKVYGPERRITSVNVERG